MSDASIHTEYIRWVGRKEAKLRRTTLDCDCPNLGVVYYHLGCDRLSCKGHAQDEHDCGDFGGVKSSTGEVSEPLEAEAPPMSDWARLAEVVSTSNAAYRCRGCRVWMPLNAKLCGPCTDLPPCGAERQSDRTGRRMVCFRPAGHAPATHEDVTGSQWVEPFGTWAEFAAPAAEHLEPVAPLVDASSDTAPDVPRLPRSLMKPPWWKPWRW